MALVRLTSFVCSPIIFGLLLTCLSTGSPAKDTNRNPVILVPGDGGSQFEAKLNKPSTVHYFCTKTSDWFSLWLNLELLAPLVLDCFVDNMRLRYNNVSRITKDNIGVQIRQPGFGNSSAVEWLDPSQMSPTSYFYYVAQALESWGFKRDVSIRGAPYDFRKAPNEMGYFIDGLKRLVEETYEMNNKNRVVLIGHSMGNPYILYMLNKQSQKWKDKYVQSFISLASPWGGAVKPIRLMVSGDNLGVFVVNALTVRPQQRSMPSTAWLMPYDTFWNADEVLATGPMGNYTVNDYRKLFTDLDYMDGYNMRKDTEKLIYNLDAPGVEVHCLHGTNVQTPASFTWTAKQWPDQQPVTHYGPGDGTVNLRSLHGCLRWTKKQKQKIYHQEFNGSDHMAILDNPDVISYIKRVVNS